jgi:hypothetical protein
VDAQAFAQSSISRIEQPVKTGMKKNAGFGRAEWKKDQSGRPAYLPRRADTQVLRLFSHGRAPACLLAAVAPAKEFLFGGREGTVEDGQSFIDQILRDIQGWHKADRTCSTGQ